MKMMVEISAVSAETADVLNSSNIHQMYKAFLGLLSQSFQLISTKLYEDIQNHGRILAVTFRSDLPNIKMLLNFDFFLT